MRKWQKWRRPWRPLGEGNHSQFRLAQRNIEEENWIAGKQVQSKLGFWVARINSDSRLQKLQSFHRWQPWKLFSPRLCWQTRAREEANWRGWVGREPHRGKEGRRWEWTEKNCEKKERQHPEDAPNPRGAAKAKGWLDKNVDITVEHLNGGRKSLKHS